MDSSSLKKTKNTKNSKKLKRFYEEISRLKKLDLMGKMKCDNFFNGCEIEKNYSNYDLNHCRISEQYFCEVNEAVENLVKFEKKHLHSSGLVNAISETIRGFGYGVDVKMLVLVDVMRCYNGLNHPTSSTTPEGMALIIFICRLLKIGNIETYENVKCVSCIHSSMSSVIDILPMIEKTSYELGDVVSSFLSKFLEKENVELDISYRKLIYKLCKTIAEVDGKISVSEKEWLEKIARLDDDDVTNDIDVG